MTEEDEGRSAPHLLAQGSEAPVEFEEFRVPITVFTTVRAADFGEAAHIARAAMRRAFKTSSIQHPSLLTIQVQINDKWFPVHIHKVMETCMAGINGYLYIEASSTAYQELS